jgi:ATP phosphoribosyltransferase regulatory subunit
VVRDALLALPRLYGDVDVLGVRATCCRPAGHRKALAELAALAASAMGRPKWPSIWPTCAVISMKAARCSRCMPGLPNAVARGGRYDHVGEVWPGTSRHRLLARFARTGASAAHRGTQAFDPRAMGQCAGVEGKIAELRKSGEVVIQSMPGHSHELDEFECDRALVLDENGSNWILKNLG